jgi:DNA-binding MarR family transcriptional regulator
VTVTEPAAAPRDPAEEGRSRSAEPGEDSLAEAIWSVARQLRHSAQDAFAPWDISPSKLRAMRVLARHEPMRLSELSDHLRIAARSATEVVDSLEAQGIARRRPDPADRRATLVELTPHGYEIGEAIRSARWAQSERIFDRLSASDRANLARILAKLQQ